MFRLGAPLWAIAVRSAVVYLVVFGGLRLLGKRELGQMTVFDLVVILLLANAVQNAMVGPDTSLEGGLLAAAVLLALNHALGYLRLRSGWWRRIIEGTPTVLIRDGRYIQPHMRREDLGHEDVEEALREHGLKSVSDVAIAVLEVDGSISIVPKGATVHRSHPKGSVLRAPHGEAPAGS